MLGWGFHLAHSHLVLGGQVEAWRDFSLGALPLFLGGQLKSLGGLCARHIDYCHGSLQ